MVLYAIKHFRPVEIRFTTNITGVTEERTVTAFVREDEEVDGMAVVDKLIDTGDIPEDGKMFSFHLVEEYTPVPAYVIVDCNA